MLSHVAPPANYPPLPPGPNGLHRVFSNMRAAQTRTLEFFSELTETYGGLVRFQAGPVPVYLVSHPTYIGHMLRDQQRLYSKDTYTYHSMRQIFGLTLITSDGPDWLQRRRTLQPVFHKRHVARMDEVVTAACCQMLDRWTHRGERTLDVQQEMMTLTLTIAGKTFFGVDLGREVAELGAAYRVLTRAFMHRYTAKGAVLWSMLGFPFPDDGQIRQARQTLEGAATQVIDEARRGGEKSQLLLELIHAQDPETGAAISDEALRAEVYTLLFTGHETTTHALVWALYLLGHHPAVADRLKQEVADVLSGRLPTAADLPQLAYTRMVLEETLRLYPPVWSFSRRAEADDQVGTYRVPKGARILICPYLTHRLPEFWPDPEHFRPERFAQPDALRLAQGYLPFGAGPRQCIGQGFALLEAQLILATLTQRCRFSLNEQSPIEPVPGFTLRPERPLFMQIECA